MKNFSLGRNPLGLNLIACMKFQCRMRIPLRHVPTDCWLQYTQVYSDSRYYIADKKSSKMSKIERLTDRINADSWLELSRNKKNNSKTIQWIKLRNCDVIGD